MKTEKEKQENRNHTGNVSLFTILFLLLVSTFAILPSHHVTAGTPVSGIIMVDTTWREVDSPIWVEGSIIVPWGIDLTIEPGVDVRVNGNHTIWIAGNLTSIGTSAKRIVFESNQTDPSHKDWFKLRVNATGRVGFSFSDFSHAFNAIELVNQTDVSFSNMSFSRSYIGISVSGSSGIKVTGSEFSDVYYGLQLSNDSNLVKNSNFQGGKRAVDVFCNEIDWDCTNNTVSENEFRDMKGGVWIRAEGTGTINSWNVVDNNSFQDVDGPVSIWNEEGVSEDNVVRQNVMVNGGYGVFLRNSDNNTIEDNRMTSFREGVALYGAERNRIVRNTIARGVDGIVVRDMDEGNVITYNTITSFTGCGVALTFSTSNNLIHHNNLLDSNNNGCDGGWNNSWDDGYPSGGNFWSDYFGPDLFSGVNQDIAGSDGKGDIPYDTMGVGRDNYPLVGMPFGNVPIERLGIQLTGNNFENVTLNWNVSWSGGNASHNITRFDIYRSENYSSNRSGYQVVASVSNYTTEFVDYKAGEGNSSNYFYYVCSANMTNVSSCSFNQVAKFTRPLVEGWNLISIPLIQEDWAVTKVLQTTTADRILTYVAGDEENPWKEYAFYKMYRDLYDMDISRGYWVHVLSDCNMTVVGTVPIKTKITHVEGWNLVGYPSFTNRTVSEALEGKIWMTVEGFDNASSPYHLRRLSGTDIMTAGEGYWVYFITSGVWTVRN
ncbi:MAG: right-handed parallel beta-helix repeat-containing protein [Methanobacteriota archaeon]|nr:MAG: right-handed parallel beta-helix repeat-containing protein [Euryarchaeota archaeon]